MYKVELRGAGQGEALQENGQGVRGKRGHEKGSRWAEVKCQGLAEVKGEPALPPLGAIETPFTLAGLAEEESVR